MGGSWDVFGWPSLVFQPSPALLSHLSQQLLLGSIFRIFTAQVLLVPHSISYSSRVHFLANSAAQK